MLFSPLQWLINQGKPRKNEIANRSLLRGDQRIRLRNLERPVWNQYLPGDVQVELWRCTKQERGAHYAGSNTSLMGLGNSFADFSTMLPTRTTCYSRDASADYVGEEGTGSF